MRNPKRSIGLLLMCVALVQHGCATIHAPSGMLPEAEDTPTHSLGGWVEIEWGLDQKTLGELLAIEQDNLYILTATSLQTIPTVEIKRVQLAYFEPHTEFMGTWTIAGALSTLSHGFYLIFTAPLLWCIGGSAATVTRSHEPVIEYPKRPLKQYRTYARYPQGLPDHVKKHGYPAFKKAKDLK